MSDKVDNESPVFQDADPEEPKRKKRRPRKKTTPSPEKKEEVNQESEQSAGQSAGQTAGQTAEQSEGQTAEQTVDQDMMDELGVNVNFQFLMTIRDILINVSPRVNWNANELLPVGMIIRDLNSIASNVNEQLSQEKKNNEEEDEEDEDDVDETSEEIN